MVTTLSKVSQLLTSFTWAGVLDKRIHFGDHQQMKTNSGIKTYQIAVLPTALLANIQYQPATPLLRIAI